jgi:hypothetical protein
MSHLDLLPSRRTAAPPHRADPLALLRALVGPGALPRTLTLWLVLLTADDRRAGPVLPLGDLPRRPAPLLVAGLLSALTTAAPAPHRLLIGYVRHGGGRRAPTEAAWSRALHRAAGPAGVLVTAEVAIGARRAGTLPPPGARRFPPGPSRPVPRVAAAPPRAR